MKPALRQALLDAFQLVLVAPAAVPQCLEPNVSATPSLKVPSSLSAMGTKSLCFLANFRIAEIACSMEAYGRPVAIYLDKFSTYKVNHKNAVDNPEFMTQFERAMKELDVRVICANSPQAKGRIERSFGTLQDRMVKEMRLADIKTRNAGNKYIREHYMPDHNKRFSVPAKSTIDAHRPLSDDLRNRLSSIFSIQSKRKVNNDYTIQFKNKWFQLEATQDIAVYKRDEVIVEERLDSTLHVRMKNVYLKYHELPERPKPLNVPVVALTKQKPDWKPPLNHPWRRNNF